MLLLLLQTLLDLKKVFISILPCELLKCICCGLHCLEIRLLELL